MLFEDKKINILEKIILTNKILLKSLAKSVFLYCSKNPSMENIDSQDLNHKVSSQIYTERQNYRLHNIITSRQYSHPTNRQTT